MLACLNDPDVQETICGILWISSGQYHASWSVHGLIIISHQVCPLVRFIHPFSTQVPQTTLVHVDLSVADLASCILISVGTSVPTSQGALSARTKFVPSQNMPTSTSSTHLRWPKVANQLKFQRNIQGLFKMKLPTGEIICCWPHDESLFY